ncbi:hypothetical protein [Nocardioides sp.]|uniref:hypothetical protein n=1 Tax=Nocardioides sp. TaxID=35761 RepID=UPI002B26C4BD|nr:hypothetical protein [Nocardioides sp.]
MIASPLQLPAPKELRDLFHDVLAKDVALRPGPPFAVSDFYPASIASYVDDTLTVRAVVALDLPLSAFAGAAVALLPGASATSAIQLGAVSGALAEGVNEICSAMTSLFSSATSRPLRLYAAHVAGSPLPADARMRTQVLGRRQDVFVDVAGYGTGRLAVVLVP